MGYSSIEHRPVRHGLFSLSLRQHSMDTKGLLQNSVLRAAANYITASILISTIAVAIVILLDRGWICFSKYQTKETIVREQIRSSSNGAFDETLPFIDFIICPAYQFAYKDKVLREYGLDSTKYRRGHYSPTINDSTISDLEFIFNEITHSPSEILKTIKITTKDRKQRSFLQNFEKGDIEKENLDMITKYQNNLGRCFSIRPKDNVVSLEVIKIDITARMDFYVYVGYPGQFMYNTKERGIARLGQRVYLDFTHELSINTIGDLEGHQCNSKLNLKFDDFWYKHVATENDKIIGCSVPWHSSYFTESNEKIEICTDSIEGRNALKIFSDAKDAPITPGDVPCARYDIDLGYPDVSDGNDKNESFIRFYLKTDIKVKSTVIYYDSTTLAAEIGGYVGMFLGVSMVDLAIMFNSFFLIMIQRMK